MYSSVLSHINVRIKIEEQKILFALWVADKLTNRHIFAKAVNVNVRLFRVESWIQLKEEEEDSKKRNIIQPCRGFYVNVHSCFQHLKNYLFFSLQQNPSCHIKFGCFKIRVCLVMLSKLISVHFNLGCGRVVTIFKKIQFFSPRVIVQKRESWFFGLKIQHD